MPEMFVFFAAIFRKYEETRSYHNSFCVNNSRQLRLHAEAIHVHPTLIVPIMHSSVSVGIKISQATKYANLEAKECHIQNIGRIEQ